MDFTGVGLKLKRAHRQAADLKTAMETALGPDRYTIYSEHDIESGDYTYRVRKVPPLDPDWTIIVGEILFDLRSALDHFAHQLVIGHSKGDPGEKTQFPIRDTPFDKQGKLVLAAIRPRLEDAELRDAIDKVQPYYGMDGAPLIDMHPLRRLSLMNNWDKHRLLLLTVHVLDIDQVWWGANDGDPEANWRLSTEPLKDGSEIARFNFGGAERPPHFQPNLALTVAIEEPLTSEGDKTRLVSLDDLLTALCWGVAQYTIGRRFLHLLPTSAHDEIFPD